MTLLVFGDTEIMPGDLAEVVLGQNATEESLAAVRQRFGLDRPLHVRYFEWLHNLTTGREVGRVQGLLQRSARSSRARRLDCGGTRRNALPSLLLLLITMRGDGSVKLAEVVMQYMDEYPPLALLWLRFPAGGHQLLRLAVF